ncbi:MAG: hypothetical protein QXR76_03285 [Candidatus Bathyarchaeia archaeon]
MPRRGFIEGPKTTVTLQIPLYLLRLIKDACNSCSQTEFIVEAVCDKLGVAVDEIMRKNREAWLITSPEGETK